MINDLAPLVEKRAKMVRFLNVWAAVLIGSHAPLVFCLSIPFKENLYDRSPDRREARTDFSGSPLP